MIDTLVAELKGSIQKAYAGIEKMGVRKSSDRCRFKKKYKSLLLIPCLEQR